MTPAERQWIDNQLPSALRPLSRVTFAAYGADPRMLNSVEIGLTGVGGNNPTSRHFCTGLREVTTMKVLTASIAVLALMAWTSGSALDRIFTLTGLHTADSLRWGSLSVDRPSSGFYGQPFVFQEQVALISISVFIINHSTFVETDAEINFGIWRYGDRPEDELFVSENQSISPGEAGAWKTFRFSQPFLLEAGTYVIGVGQTEPHAPIAFGNALSSDDNEGKEVWILTPYKDSILEPRSPSWCEATGNAAGEDLCPNIVERASLMMTIETTSPHT